MRPGFLEYIYIQCVYLPIIYIYILSIIPPFLDKKTKHSPTPPKKRAGHLARGVGPSPVFAVRLVLLLLSVGGDADQQHRVLGDAALDGRMGESPPKKCSINHGKNAIEP